MVRGLLESVGAVTSIDPAGTVVAVAQLLRLRWPAGRRSHETVVGGVKGLVLPGSDDPASLSPLGGRDGRRYFVYKAFLAVSSTAPFAVASVIRRASARLVYGASTKLGAGDGLVTGSRPSVGLPTCRAEFTGFVGGIILTRPTCVTFEVSSPDAKKAIASVEIGRSECSGPPAEVSG